MHFAYKSPFQLKPPIVGIVVYNSIGHPVFSTNARMHPGNYNMQASSEGVISLRVNSLPLMTGTYTLSCFFGDMTTDYNSYFDIIKFNFFANNVDSSKVSDVKYVGSLNLSNADWSIVHKGHSILQ